MAKTIGMTWNGNPSGRLWECIWRLEDDGTGSAILCAPGVWVPASKYPDEAALRVAFEAERAEFHGRAL